MAQWKQVVVGRSPPAPNTTSVGGGPVVGSWVEVTGPTVSARTVSPSRAKWKKRQHLRK